MIVKYNRQNVSILVACGANELLDPKFKADPKLKAIQDKVDALRERFLKFKTEELEPAEAEILQLIAEVNEPYEKVMKKEAQPEENSEETEKQ